MKADLIEHGTTNPQSKESKELRQMWARDNKATEDGWTRYTAATELFLIAHFFMAQSQRCA
jgi:hypothetical protein